MADKTSPLVMVTGANGLVGYGVVARALEDGYRVRAVVRREGAADAIRKAPTAQKYLETGALSITLVPDSAGPGAYVDAAQDCDFIVHTATPLPNKGPKDIIGETNDSTRRILEAAEATASVRRVVFTSSIYAVLDYNTIISGADTPAANADTQLVLDEKLAQSPCGHLQYNVAKAASKIYVEKYYYHAAADATKGESGCHFSIVSILPGFIIGPSEMMTTRAESMGNSGAFLAHMWADLTPRVNARLGVPEDGPAIVWGCHTHLDDCSEAHVKALDTDRVKGGLRNFLVVSDAPSGAAWGDAEGILKEDRPDTAKTIDFVPCTLMAKPVHLDVGDSDQELLGHKPKSYRQIVCDTVPWMLSLPA